jgi:uncharacterized membrane protein
MDSINVLLVGETVFKIHTHYKGFACYETAYITEKFDFFTDKVKGEGINLAFMPNHDVSSNFPMDTDSLEKYDVVVISDAPADSFLLHPKTLAGERVPNRLKLIVDYVKKGHGFLMIGGWMSFCGFQGKARYHMSPLSEILPTKMCTGDDRMEIPEGASPTVELSQHPILNGIPTNWPYFLGYNKLMHHKGTTLMNINNDPFLVVDQVEKGRVGVFSSDCLPHWAPSDFCEWEFYAKFWGQLFRWLKG